MYQRTKTFPTMAFCLRGSLFGSQCLISCVRLTPYIGAIVCLKMLVIMVLVSYRQGANQFTTFNDYGMGASDDAEKDSKLEITPRAEDPFRREKEVVFSNLNGSVLIPSSQNRTPHETIWLFFNRVPRTGGQTLVSLLKALGEDLDYDHQEHEYRTPWKRLLAEEEKKNLASWFEYSFWPKTYDRFSMFVNFTKYRSHYLRTKPAYVTLVRDPVDKFVSHFHSKRKNPEVTKREMAAKEREKPGLGRLWYWKKIDDCVLENDPECAFEEGMPNFLSSIPFLCGQHEQCLKNGNKWALQMAKFNAEYEYSVVGMLEHWNDTLTVLEYYVPRFFKGAYHRYWSDDFPDKHVNKNPKKYVGLSAKATDILKDKFALEFEFYEFVEQRLHRQLSSMKAQNYKLASDLPKRTPAPKQLSPVDRFKIELRAKNDIKN